MLFIALPQTPHLAIRYAQNFGCLPPGDLLRHRSQDHFLYLHRPLHCGPWIRLQTKLLEDILAAR
jgi:hypothetical protein